MKRKEISLRDFLQSVEYEVLKMNLQNEINNNSVMFNTKLDRDGVKKPFTNNLTALKEEKVKHTQSEIEALKLAKKQWKQQSSESLDGGRNQILSQLTNLGVPNWNVKFKSI